MSIQPSQVASIDLSRKPEGATHYSVNRPDACVMDWYKLESGKWKFWGFGRWTSVSGAAPAKEVFEIPARPDWSKGPADATHWGPAASVQNSCIAYAECFYKFSQGGSMVATEMFDWEWRQATRDVTPERRAMLIERPYAIDWSAAPDWAIGHGLLSDDQTPAWIGKTQYLYAGSRATPYQFSSTQDHPLFFHRDDVKGYVERPRQDFASQVQEGIEDAEAGNLVALDDVKARRESRSAWDGEGLPPIGVACEHEGTADNREWIPVKVIAHTVMRNYEVAVFEYEETISYSTANHFRPIRTPEQIAADERLRKIRNAATHIAAVLSMIDEDHAYAAIAVIEAMIDAGYARPSAQVVEIEREEALGRMHKLYIEGASEHKGGLASLYDGGMRFVEVKA